VSLNPNKAESHRELGVCYNKQGKLALAVDAFEKALGLEPNDTLVQALLRDLGNRTFGYDGFEVLAHPNELTWIVVEWAPPSLPNWPQRGWSVQAVSGDVDPDRFHFVVQHAKPSGYAGEPQRIMTLWVYHMIEPGEAGRVGYFTATHCLCQHELRLALRYAWEFGPCIVGGSRH
jgi:tetratricopeptide (TPR) repeat protein